jgi:hypothetical protein
MILPYLYFVVFICLKIFAAAKAFISFALPKETEPKKRQPLSPYFQKISYLMGVDENSLRSNTRPLNPNK